MQRSSMEYGAVFFAVIGIFFGMVESTYTDMDETKRGEANMANQNSPNDNICLTIGCRRAAIRIMNSMDQSKKPCDDFYQFACGRYYNSSLKPSFAFDASESTLSDDTIKKRMIMSYEATTATNQPWHFRLAKNLYDSCMNTSRIEADGVTPLLNILKKLGGWPIIYHLGKNQPKLDFITMRSKIMNTGYPDDVIFNAGIYDEKTYSFYSLILWMATILARLVLGRLKNNHISMLQLSNPDSGISDAQYDYGTYWNYMIKVAKYLGANTGMAKLKIAEVMKFQDAIHKLVQPSRINRDRTDYFTNVKILTDVYPNFPWKEYFASFVPSNITITDDNKVLVSKDCNIYGLHELFAKSRSTVIMNYMLWRVVDRSILYLNEGMREIYYSLPGRYYERQARSMMCVSEVIQSLPMSARALCAKDYFPREAKAAAVELFSNIKTIFKNDYNKRRWDHDFWQNGTEEIDKLSLLTDYPDELLNDRKVNSYYRGLKLTGENYLKSTLNVALFRMRNSKVRLHSERDKWRVIGNRENITHTDTYNLQSTFLSAYELQGIYLRVDRPSYLNYGGLGSVIGRNIIQSKSRKKYFPDRYLIGSDIECIIRQYNSYSSKHFRDNAGGKLKRDTNIAETVGFVKAYHAYIAWATANKPEKKLPELDYTPRQMFWITLANTLCTDISPDMQNHDLAFKDYSNNEYRVNGPLSNSVEFSKDFNCPIGSTMNPVKKCRFDGDLI